MAETFEGAAPAVQVAAFGEGAAPAVQVAAFGRELVLRAHPGETLAQTIWLSGQTPVAALCSGLGRCGACKVRIVARPPAKIPDPVPADVQVLGQEAVDLGWRLACHHKAVDGLRVELPGMDASKQENVTCEIAEPNVSEQLGSLFSEGQQDLLLAVDLGTTSIHWRVFTPEGRVLGQQSALNPQLGAGSDVMSRVAMALTAPGRARLGHLVRVFLKKVVTRCAFGGCTRVKAMCVAGNTAMTSILLDKDCSGLAAAPYSLPERGGRWARLEEGDSPRFPFPPVWIPPQLGPFAGGDVSAGMIALLAKQGASPAFPFVLADLGTNGECVLALDEQSSLVTSVPLGPSLEGIGLTHGGVADEGSLTGFRLTPTGLQGVQYQGTGDEANKIPPRSISGTGYLSLVDVLLRAGVLTPQGSLGSSGGAMPLSPLARRLLSTVSHASDSPGWSLPLPYGFALTGQDVEELLKVKAAFSLALEGLLRAGHRTPGDLRTVVLAGALGEHAPCDVLERLGFLPTGLVGGGRVRMAGNTSLQGAALLLQHPDLQTRLSDWSAGCRVLDLTAAPDFFERYMEHMRWGEKEDAEPALVCDPLC